VVFNSLKTILESFADYNLSSKGEILKTAVLDDKELAISLATFRKETYCRQIIHKVKDFDVVLIGWMPAQQSPIHNHPTNGCLVYPLQGELLEERFCEELHPISTTTVGLGQYSYIDNGICLHKLGNASEVTPAISVHIYSPSNFVSTIFRENGETEQIMKAIP